MSHRTPEQLLERGWKTKSGESVQCVALAEELAELDQQHAYVCDWTPQRLVTWLEQRGFPELAGLSLVESLLMRFVVDAPQLADSGYMPFIDVIVGLGFFALIVFWCINFQQACKKIGKKNGFLSDMGSSMYQTSVTTTLLV
jgi:hypothetical protein